MRTSFIALIFSIIAFAVSLIRFQPISYDWATLLVTALGGLATVLVGWQIYNVITFEKQLAKLRNEFSAIAKTAADDVKYQLIATISLTASETLGQPDIDLLIGALKTANNIVNDDENLRGQIVETISSVASPTSMTQKQKVELVETLAQIPEPQPEGIGDIYQVLFPFHEVSEDSSDK